MNTGVSLFFKSAPTVVEKVSAGVITSEPSSNLHASIPKNKAEEPEFRYKEYYFEKRVAIFFSNSLEYFPI